MATKKESHKSIKPSVVLKGLEKYRKQNKSKKYLEQLGERLDEDIFPVNFVIERYYKGGLQIPEELQFTELTSFDKDAVRLFATLKLDIDRIDHWRLFIACVASLLTKSGRSIEPFDREFQRFAQELSRRNRQISGTPLAKLIQAHAKVMIERLKRMPEDAEHHLPSGKKAKVSEVKSFYGKIYEVENIRKKLRKLSDSERNSGKRLVREGYLRIALLRLAQGENMEEVLQSVARLVSAQNDIKIA